MTVLSIGREVRKQFPSSQQPVPVLYMALSLTCYCAFAATFEAMEASIFQSEKVLEYPGQQDLMDDIELVPEEFSLRMKTSITTRKFQSMRELQKTMKQSKHQMYLLHPRTSHQLRLSATDPSALTLRLIERKLRTHHLPPPTIKLN